MSTHDVIDRLIEALTRVDDDGYVRVLASDVTHLLTYIDQPLDESGGQKQEE